MTFPVTSCRFYMNCFHLFMTEVGVIRKVFKSLYVLFLESIYNNDAGSQSYTEKRNINKIMAKLTSSLQMFDYEEIHVCNFIFCLYQYGKSFLQSCPFLSKVWNPTNIVFWCNLDIQKQLMDVHICCSYREAQVLISSKKLS